MLYPKPSSLLWLYHTFIFLNFYIFTYQFLRQSFPSPVLPPPFSQKVLPYSSFLDLLSKIFFPTYVFWYINHLMNLYPHKLISHLFKMCVIILLRVLIYPRILNWLRSWIWEPDYLGVNLTSTTYSVTA